jgi:hypothetical protein
VCLHLQRIKFLFRGPGFASNGIFLVRAKDTKSTASVTLALASGAGSGVSAHCIEVQRRLDLGEPEGDSSAGRENLGLGVEMCESHCHDSGACAMASPSAMRRAKNQVLVVSISAAGGVLSWPGHPTQVGEGWQLRLQFLATAWHGTEVPNNWTSLAFRPTLYQCQRDLQRISR